jgi:hypothetical protein
MLYRGFACPGPENARGLSSVRLSADECTEDFAAGVTCRCAISHRVEDFDAVAGTDVKDLRYAEGVPQSGEARGYLGLGDRETSDLIDTDMPIGQTHHANLVHGAKETTGRGPVCH